MQETTFFGNLIREPLLHFALIGAAVFLLYPGNSGPVAAPIPTDYVIDITPQVRDRLAAQFAGTWNRQPTAQELDGLMAEQVKEEVLYREALVLGLDRDDPVIRQRMRLKMEFIGEGAAAALVPTEGELAAWYAANAADYAAPATVSFVQVMLTDPSEAEATFAALAEGADPATLGRGTLLPGAVSEGSALSVDGLFGKGFFAEVSAQSPGVWAGPVGSAYGAHLVRLDAVTASEAARLDTVHDVVLEDWRRDQAQQFLERQYQAFLARYDVRLPDPAGQ